MEFLLQRLGLVGLSAVYVFLERRFPAKRRPFFREGLGTDVLHLFFTELFTNAVVFAVLAVVWFPLQALKWDTAADFIAAQPRWWVVVTALLLVDFLGYWSHRLQHVVPRLWRFHAVHHSSHTLDWFAGVRRHPVDEALGRLALFIPLVWLGFGAEVLGGLGGLLGLYVGLLHTNVRWRFGPLRPFIGTPDLHHWHHAWVESGHGHNFGTFFTLWDRVFGTFHLPEERPLFYGTTDPVPRGYVGQLVGPLRREAGGLRTSER